MTSGGNIDGQSYCVWAIYSKGK